MSRELPTSLEDLSETELDLLYLFASGYTSRQIVHKLRITIGVFQTLRDELHQKLGAFSRAHAVVIAIVRLSLPPPQNLLPVIAELNPQQFRFEDALDEDILKLLAEGYHTAEIAAVLALPSKEYVLERIAALTVQFGITTYMFARVVAAGAWSGLLTDLDLDRRLSPSEANQALMLDVALGHSVEEIAIKLGIAAEAAKGRIRKILFRLGAKTRAEGIATMIRSKWLPVPADNQVTQQRIALIQARGLTHLELDVIHHRMDGRSFQWIKSELGFNTEEQPAWIIRHLFRQVGLQGSRAADMLTALVLWAGEPLVPSEPLFSDYEETILVLLAWGLEGAAIAYHMGQQTKFAVDFHIRKIYEKLGAENAEQAVALAIRNHVIDIATDAEIEPVMNLSLKQEEHWVAELAGEGCSYDDIAGKLGISRTTVSRRMDAVRKAVRKVITEPGYQPIHITTTTAIALLARAGRIKVEKREYPPVEIRVVRPQDIEVPAGEDVMHDDEAEEAFDAETVEKEPLDVQAADSETTVDPIVREMADDQNLLDWLARMRVYPSDDYVFDKTTEETIHNHGSRVVELVRTGKLPAPEALKPFFGFLRSTFSASDQVLEILQAMADCKTNDEIDSEFEFRNGSPRKAKIEAVRRRFKVRRDREMVIVVLAMWAKFVR